MHVATSTRHRLYSYRYDSVSIDRKEQGDREAFAGWGKLPVPPAAAPAGATVPTPSARRTCPPPGAERRTGSAGREWHARVHHRVRRAASRSEQGDALPALALGVGAARQRDGRRVPADS